MDLNLLKTEKQIKKHFKKRILTFDSYVDTIADYRIARLTQDEMYEGLFYINISFFIPRLDSFHLNDTLKGLIGHYKIFKVSSNLGEHYLSKYDE